MKKKSLKLESHDFFRQRVHRKDSSGNMPKLVKPGSQRSGAESVIVGILRWADDGGRMLELGNQETDQPRMRLRIGQTNDDCPSKSKPTRKASRNNDSKSDVS